MKRFSNIFLHTDTKLRHFNPQ